MCLSFFSGQAFIKNTFIKEKGKPTAKHLHRFYRASIIYRTNEENLSRFFIKNIFSHFEIFYFELTADEICQNTWFPIHMNQDIDASISLPLRVPADPAAWRGLSSTEFRQAVVANQAELGSFPETDGKKNFFF